MKLKIISRRVKFIRDLIMTYDSVICREKKTLWKDIYRFQYYHIFNTCMYRKKTSRVFYKGGSMYIESWNNNIGIHHQNLNIFVRKRPTILEITPHQSYILSLWRITIYFMEFKRDESQHSHLFFFKWTPYIINLI